MFSFIGLPLDKAQEKAEKEGVKIAVEYYFDKKTEDYNTLLCIRERAEKDLTTLVFGNFKL